VSRTMGSILHRAVLRQIFSQYIGILCHSFILQIATQSSAYIIHGLYDRPINGRSNSGLGSTPAPQIKIKKNKTTFYRDVPYWRVFQLHSYFWRPREKSQHEKQQLHLKFLKQCIRKIGGRKSKINIYVNFALISNILLNIKGTRGIVVD
jgi:hypothetical protein